MDEKRLFQLFNAKSDGTIDPEAHDELQKILKESAAARELWFLHQDVDAGLASFAESPTIEKPAPKSIPFRSKWFALSVAVAAIAVVAPWFFMSSGKPPVYAELASVENAAWESSLPTEPGSQLTEGTMKLTEGIAVIRFRSGAEMMLEAPARLQIISSMKAHLLSGAAIINVPDSAIGFIVETPQGHVVDHGTSFAVNVKDHKNRSDIEVIEGEVSLHTPQGNDAVRLYTDQGASILSDEILVRNEPIEEVSTAEPEKTIRLGTNGRSYSVISSNQQKRLPPELLMVKRRKPDGNFERRSFFAFDISEVDLEKVSSVRLRLIQVPSGFGYATRLPLISRIGIYGLTNMTKADWQPGITWQEGPAPEDGIKLGDIEIPRSEQSGSRVFQSDSLLNFLKMNQSKTVTFILERETADIKGNVPSLVHAFASDFHPEAVGPTLEFTLKN
ncbi:MAG: FecR domain-containing protein [Verrucomicrobiales bacterium]|nr:FecR domain-containing protein [Verrucomicrobiales bacterium]